MNVTGDVIGRPRQETEVAPPHERAFEVEGSHSWSDRSAGSIQNQRTTPRRQITPPKPTA
jgi:hypothetical protein